jgi:hypothetical protein
LFFSSLITTDIFFATQPFTEAPFIINQPAEFDDIDVVNLFKAALSAMNEVFDLIARYGLSKNVCTYILSFNLTSLTNQIVLCELYKGN